MCVSQTLAALPDQDSFYDVTDSLEQLGMETIMHKHMNHKGTEPDLRAQFTVYEVLKPVQQQQHHCSKPRLTLIWLTEPNTGRHGNLCYEDTCS